MITHFDLEVRRQFREDTLKWAEQERLFREITKTTKIPEVPMYSQLLSLIGQWLINSGEFLQRRHRNAVPAI